MTSTQHNEVKLMVKVLEELAVPTAGTISFSREFPSERGSKGKEV